MRTVRSAVPCDFKPVISKSPLLPYRRHLSPPELQGRSTTYMTQSSVDGVSAREIFLANKVTQAESHNECHDSILRSTSTAHPVDGPVLLIETGLCSAVHACGGSRRGCENHWYSLNMAKEASPPNLGGGLPSFSAEDVLKDFLHRVHDFRR